MVAVAVRLTPPEELRSQSALATTEAATREGPGIREFVPAGIALIEFSLVALVSCVIFARVSVWWVWAYPASVVTLLAGCGSYRRRITLSVAGELRSLLSCALLPLVVVALSELAPARQVLAAALAACATLLVLRAGAYHWLRYLRRRGALQERVLIVGAGKVGVALSSILAEHAEYGLRPVGFVDEVDEGDLPLPLLGGVRDLRGVLGRYGIDRVVIAFGVAREAEMLETIRACKESAVDIHVLPRFFELGIVMGGKDVDEVWGIPLVHLRPSLRSHASRVAKRVNDVVAASLAMLALSPLLVLLAALVKLSGPGPVIFRQKRIGQSGRIVEVHKFRTMVPHPGSDAEWVAPEERVTRAGRIMRRFGLDELPQLFDIVRGDLSLVGPRPERPYFAERFRRQVPHYDARLRVPVGVAGLAQAKGLRGDSSIDDRVRFDNLYIETWSLWGDLELFVKTLLSLLQRSRPDRHRIPGSEASEQGGTGSGSEQGDHNFEEDLRDSRNRQPAA